jgi:hypothetical protein
MELPQHRHILCESVGRSVLLTVCLQSSLSHQLHTFNIMPVTFKVTSHDANPYQQNQLGASCAEDVLKRACHHQAKQCKELLQTFNGW